MLFMALPVREWQQSWFRELFNQHSASAGRSQAGLTNALKESGFLRLSRA